ncbi:hypothetical protein N7452_003872, partial [Penicillium brevicompactum]
IKSFGLPPPNGTIAQLGERAIEVRKVAAQLGERAIEVRKVAGSIPARPIFFDSFIIRQTDGHLFIYYQTKISSPETVT